MARIFMHQPLNISRALEEMLGKFALEQEAKSGIHVEIVSEMQCQPEKEGQNGIEHICEGDEKDLPDMFIVHENYFTGLPEDYLKKNFISLPGRFPIRAELKDKFGDPEGYIHPFTVMPFAMFYNPSQLNEKQLPKFWSDILNPCWKDKICMPDKNHLAPKAIRSYIKANYPESFDDFLKNIVYMGAPVNVVNAVDSGQYPMGITNISFARISRNKNIRILWPEDGMLCIPQIMAWSRKADERLLEFGDFMRSPIVQEYLALQSFIPVTDEIDFPKLIKEHNIGSLKKIL